MFVSTSTFASNINTVFMVMQTQTQRMGEDTIDTILNFKVDETQMFGVNEPFGFAVSLDAYFRCYFHHTKGALSRRIFTPCFSHSFDGSTGSVLCLSNSK